MSRFFGVLRHEFRMSIRRPGFWISYTLLSLFYIVTSLTPSADGSDVIGMDQIWEEAGQIVFMYNIFLPLLAGILAADRVQRDFRTGIRELQRSTPISAPAYVLSKYFGVLLSVLLPMFLLVFVTGALAVAARLAPLAFLWPLLLAFLTMAVPTHAFVLACPLVMPLRVYQVLFTGYWFWGNLLNSQVFPTISDTVLNAIGQYSAQAFFGFYTDPRQKAAGGFTPPEAVLNLLVLMSCIAVALYLLNRYLRWQERRA